jgi:hypothetical protein
MGDFKSFLIGTAIEQGDNIPLEDRLPGEFTPHSPA